MENILPLILMCMATPSAAGELARFPDRQSAEHCLKIATAYKDGCEKNRDNAFTNRERAFWEEAHHDARVREWQWQMLVWCHQLQAGEVWWGGGPGPITKSPWPCLYALRRALDHPPGGGESAWRLGEMPWPTPKRVTGRPGRCYRSGYNRSSFVYLWQLEGTGRTGERAPWAAGATSDSPPTLSRDQRPRRTLSRACPRLPSARAAAGAGRAGVVE